MLYKVGEYLKFRGIYYDNKPMKIVEVVSGDLDAFYIFENSKTRIQYENVYEDEECEKLNIRKRKLYRINFFISL